MAKNWPIHFPRREIYFLSFLFVFPLLGCPLPLTSENWEKGSGNPHPPLSSAEPSPPPAVCCPGKTCQWGALESQRSMGPLGFTQRSGERISSMLCGPLFTLLQYLPWFLRDTVLRKGFPFHHIFGFYSQSPPTTLRSPV